MKLPKKVKISYVDYTILEYLKTEAEAAKELGDCEQEAKIIRMKIADCSRQNQANTLQHEILHAVKYEYDISLKNEESIVTGFANGLCQVRRDNPEIEEFLKRSLQ